MLAMLARPPAPPATRKPEPAKPPLEGPELSGKTSGMDSGVSWPTIRGLSVPVILSINAGRTHSFARRAP